MKTLTNKKNKAAQTINFFSAFGALLLATACNNGLGAAAGNSLASSATTGTAAAAPTAPATNSTGSSSTAQAYQYVPLAWEASNPAAKSWSTYLYSVLASQSALLAGSSDVTNFCPQYYNLSTNQKINFWGMLISGVSKYESNFNPLDRYEETGLGIDPITGTQVYSEGLLQLSYQDILSYPFCKFNWSVDKNLSATNPNKTTLNPDINLSCGTQILNKQVANHGSIVMPLGHAYWSTLESGSKYNQIANIEEMTNNLPFCN